MTPLRIQIVLDNWIYEGYRTGVFESGTAEVGVRAIPDKWEGDKPKEGLPTGEIEVTFSWRLPKQRGQEHMKRVMYYLQDYKSSGDGLKLSCWHEISKTYTLIGGLQQAVGHIDYWLYESREQVVENRC